MGGGLVGEQEAGQPSSSEKQAAEHCCCCCSSPRQATGRRQHPAVSCAGPGSATQHPTPSTLRPPESSRRALPVYSRTHW